MLFFLWTLKKTKSKNLHFGIFSTILRFYFHRYLADPTKDGHSIENAVDYCPGINVHFSSGVFNKAFYLLTTTEDWDTWVAFDVFLTAKR